MRSLIFAAALLTAQAAAAVESSTFQLRDTNDLVRACSVAPDHALYANAMGFCHGLLVGAYGYYASTITPEGRFICPPNPVPPRSKVMNDFVAWARMHPQFMKDAPIDTLFRYLAETYPCGK